MICRLPGDPLQNHAYYILSTSSSPTSWLIQVRNIFLLYQLPHPLKLLQDPPNKEAFKKLVKSKVTDFWEKKLQNEASFLPSLTYFHPEYMSLASPHRIWTTAGQKCYEVAKARIQLLFLSSRYPCAKFSRLWSKDNPQGFCSFSHCQERQAVESPAHILLNCLAYASTRNSMIAL